MKKVLLLLTVLLTTLGVQGQTIKKGDKFWDGQKLYTVHVGEDGNLCLYDDLTI